MLMMQVDLHGYRPADIVGSGVLVKIVRQAWEMGMNRLMLIHGHGRRRGRSPGFVHTNTGIFGLAIRRALRRDQKLRQWIKYTTLECNMLGATSIRLKSNPTPTRTQLDDDLFPPFSFPPATETRDERNKVIDHLEPLGCSAYSTQSNLR
jgi:hypothetical protein